MENVNLNITPKHKVLQAAFRKSLAAGEFAPGERFPSQSELCSEYGVAINTVREAVAGLVSEGLLIRIHGKGTFVAQVAYRQLTVGLVLDVLGPNHQFELVPTSNISVPYVHFIHKMLVKNSAGMVLCMSNECVDLERQNLLGLIERKVDGAVVFYIDGEQNLDCLRLIQDSGIPLVMLDRYVEGFECDYVVADNYSGAKRAVECLIERGFENIIHFTYSDHVSSVSDREAGYRAALAEHGLSDNIMVVPILGMDMDWDVRKATELAGRTLSSVDGKFAVFLAHSGLLQQVWPWIEAKNLSHSDVGVACFDEFDPGWLPDDVLLIKALMPIESMAEKSVEIIVEKIAGSQQPRQLTLEPTIIVHDPGSGQLLSSVS